MMSLPASSNADLALSTLEATTTLSLVYVFLFSKSLSVPPKWKGRSNLFNRSSNPYFDCLDRFVRKQHHFQVYIGGYFDARADSRL